MADVALTVLFATRNGDSVLPRTLEAYCRVQQPPHGWKMVIVENGSDDSTAAILESYKTRLPLEILRQPTAGQNRARNRGLDVIEGPLTILTDDDAIPDPTFLTAWSKYLDRCQGYELFGGTIEPLFEVPPPKWIFENRTQFDMLFAARDLSEGPIAPDQIFGPNMAVSSSVFERGFRFNEDLGPNKSDPNYPIGGETDLFHRVARTGGKAWFAEEPRVQHIVRRNQLKRSYWAKRAYQHGRGTALQIWQRGETFTWDGSRPVALDQLSRLLQMLSPSPLRRFTSACDYHWTRGFREEWAKRSAGRPAPTT
jgi:glycosyltransferase involved in cell wall biosynthesis